MLVVFLVGREDQDVVQIYDDESIQKWSKYVVQEVLERGGGVRQAERHHIELEMTISCSKGGLPFVALFDTN